MRILWLGPFRGKMDKYMRGNGDTIKYFEVPIDNNSDCLNNIDFIVSYGYRYIINEDIIDRFKKRIVNLHISYLPWNRGAHPNFWSFLDDTPKGVSIHLINEGVDTGDLLVQKAVSYCTDDTLKVSYNRLSDSIELLFLKFWPDIRLEKIKPIAQIGKGSTHKKQDLEKYKYLLHKGWDTPVLDILNRQDI
jgi:methionyl-tRNA formyltransferase